MMRTKLSYLANTVSPLDTKWQELLASHSDLLIEIDHKLTELSKSNTLYPPKEHIFRALELTPPDKVRVVILGQDPYHGINQANGLAFSVNHGELLPPSLKNIFKELAIEYPDTNLQDVGGDLLLNWAMEGVLLLNSSLSVIENQPNSLQNLGFEIITDEIISYLSNTYSNIVFILWGAFAIKKSVLIDKTRHCVLTSVHPSPLSAHRGFFGCNHFRLCNEYLQQNGHTPINWLEYEYSQSSLF